MTDPAGPPRDFSPRITPPYLVGVLLGVNAIEDACLFLDGPACFELKTPSIQGNHDWFSRLTDVSGSTKVVTSGLHPSTVAADREDLYGDVLRQLAGRDEGVIFLSARPMAAITGVDYERVVRSARTSLDANVVLVPPRSLRSDWLGGYAEVLTALARSVDLDGASPVPRRVAAVGYLFDRHEGDHEGNLAELRRLLAGMGLELDVVWLSGTAFEDLGRIRQASAILSLPYGRSAARILSERLSVPLVETALPLGFGQTERFLRDVGAALGAAEAAERVIDRELAVWAPRLEWVIPFVFQHARVGFIGDPHHLGGVAELLGMMGASVDFALLSAERSRHGGEVPQGASERVSFDPTSDRAVSTVAGRIAEGGLDLLVTCSLEATLPEVPIVELGYPSFHTHALVPRPFLGFAGAVGLAERMANAMRQAERYGPARPAASIAEGPPAPAVSPAARPGRPT